MFDHLNLKHSIFLVLKSSARQKGSHWHGPVLLLFCRPFYSLPLPTLGPSTGLGTHCCSHFIAQGSIDFLQKGPGSNYLWFCELRSLSHSYSTVPLSCESSSHIVWYCVDSTYMKKHEESIKLYLQTPKSEFPRISTCYEIVFFFYF